MVEINNHVRRSSICWRGRRELQRTSETRNHGYDVIVGGELFIRLLRSPSQTCHAKPKTQINSAGRYQLCLSCWWDAYRKQLGLERLLRKSGRCGIAAD